MYDQSVVFKVNNDVWPKYWITKVNKVLYYKCKQNVRPKYCIIKQTNESIVLQK